MESLGTELQETPYPLIGVLGSHDLQQKVLPYLRTVNEEFAPKLRFVSLPREHRFPVKKELREKHGTFPNQTQRDFEGYRIQGILKARWIQKHHELLPAVVLLFDEFDPRWGPQEWQQKETMLREEVEKLKRVVAARECRVMLLLMQQVDDAGVAPMNTTEERLSTLRKKLETDAKGLVLVRSRDLVRGSSLVIKLESSVRNLAIEYYKAQSKRVKRYKKALAKTPPGYQALLARFCFKIAHYYEFRRYTSKVLQYYEASYRAIIALPLHENETIDGIAYPQVLTMAEYVNYKLCYHLIFSSTNLKGAVDQLHRHMGVYGRTLPVPDRAYEHWEWVSRQYQVFAHLLAEASSTRSALNTTGLDSTTYKEPYLYYYLAAKYAIFRRKAAAKRGLSKAAGSTISATDSNESERDFVVVPSVFVGGDPVVSEAQGTLTDSSVSALVKYRDAMETAFPHTKRSIELLEHALQHLTMYVATQNVSRNRLKCRLLVHLGTERLASGDYDRSRAELEKAKALFSSENCWAQTAQILKHLLVCSFRQGDTAAYLDYALQLLSPVVEEFVSIKERGRIQESFVQAWREPMALGAPFTADSVLANGHEVALDRSRSVFTLTAHFDRASACVKENVTLELNLQSHFPLPLVIARLEVVFNDERYRTILDHHPADSSEELSPSLEFTPKAIKQVYVPLRVLEGRQLLALQEVRLFLKNRDDESDVEREQTAVEKFLIFSLLVELAAGRQIETRQPYLMNGRVPAMGNGTASPSFSRRKAMFSLVEGPRVTPLEIEPIQDNGAVHLKGSSLMILRPRANATVTLTSKEALLTGEFRNLAFELAANDDTMENVTIRMACEPPPTAFAREEAFFFLQEAGNLTPMPLDATFQPCNELLLPNQAPQSIETFHVMVRSTKARPVTLLLTVTYTTKTGATVGLDTRFDVVCQDPFAIAGGFIYDYLSGYSGVSGTGAQLPRGSYACVGSLVNYQGSVTCTSHEALHVLAMHFEPRETTDMMESLATSGFEARAQDELDMNTKDVGSTFYEGDARCFCLRLVPKVASNFVTLGRVEIIWKRQKEASLSSESSVHTYLDLPIVSFLVAPLTIHVEIPPFGIEGVLFSINIRIKNNEAGIQCLKVKPIEEDGAFFIAGRTNCTENVLPFEEQVFQLALVPTKTGYLVLPRLEIVSLTYNVPVSDFTERQELFVLPRKCPEWVRRI